MIPEQLGPYRIIGTLGRGGMGAVYRAVHVETDEPAAIKTLAAGLSQEEGFRQRFEAEIETLRKLYHPNIVQLFGFGEQDGILFYAMELVEGSSLEEEIRRGRRFDWREVAQMGIQICRALRHAHDRGVIHRDIKPANLLLTPDGRVKLSDFGIARLYGYSRMTAAGSVLGTVEYMAPEQADARPVGPRTDLYSLGGVLYALLARRPPFRASSLAEMLDKQRSAIPDPVRRYAPDVPEEFELIVAQLLEKDPEKRIANATLLARRLEAMLRALAGGADASAAAPASGPQAPARPAPAAPADSSPPAAPVADELPPTRLAGDSWGPPAAPSAAPAAPTRRHDLEPPVPLGPTAAEESPSRSVPGSVAPAGRPSGGDLAETRDDSEVPVAAEPVRRALTTPRTVPGKPTVAGTFVALDEEDLDRYEPERPPSAIISLQTWILAAALMAIGVGAWYFLRPLSADDLYERIVRRTADKTIESFLFEQHDIDEFLSRFPADPRAEHLRRFRREIELYTRERRLTSPAKGRLGGEGLLPIERAYMRAVHAAQADPEEGMARLQALIDLYSDRDNQSGPTGECLELARR
ncbi:MAG: serine/threonine protein kinase, partial [Thermoguttaceae bacterium]|nr:serine/threonine protein kinase [Thermoguttaceae bacterium]